jgi:hypothetical protein
MPTVTTFLGIDARSGAAKKFGSMLDALNLSIASGGGLVRRPALRYRVALPAASKGLFAVGNMVCAAAPSGTSATGLAPDFNLAYLSGGTLTGVEGVAVDSSGKPLILAKNASGGADLHASPAVGATPSGATLLTPGFTPLAGGLCKAGSRAWCLDDGDGSRLLRWSAVDDPAYPGSLGIWSPAADPNNEARRGNFIDLGQHTAAGGKPVGIVEWNGRVVVMFPNAVQVWRVGAAETDRYLEQVINGPGLVRNGGAAQVGQDVVFLGDSLVVHSLRAATITQGAEAGSPGEPVDDLLQSGLRINDATTYPMWDLGRKPLILHAKARGELLMALGRDLLVLGWGLGNRPRGWTRWKLPVPVDYWCEVAGTIFIRSGDVAYSLDPSINQGDEVTAGVYTPIPVLGDMVEAMVSANLATVSRIYCRSSEDLRVQVVRDGRPSRQNDGSLGSLGTTVLLPGRGSVPSSVMSAWPCRTVGFRFYDPAATASWRLDEFGFDVRATPGHGVDPS